MSRAILTNPTRRISGLVSSSSLGVTIQVVRKSIPRLKAMAAIKAPVGNPGRAPAHCIWPESPDWIGEGSRWSPGG